MSDRIEQAYEITMAQLRGWNPDLREDYGNLLLNTAYCVSGPTPGTTPTPTPTPTGSPTTPPGPTQSGIAAKCNRYVLQKTGCSVQIWPRLRASLSINCTLGAQFLAMTARVYGWVMRTTLESGLDHRVKGQYMYHTGLFTDLLCQIWFLRYRTNSRHFAMI